jgi:hypothetical protein
MSALLAFFGIEGEVLSRRMRLFALGALIGGALIALAAAFLAFAAYLALADVMKPWQAALTTGALCLLFGAILVVAALESLNHATNQVQGAMRANVLVRAAPLVAQVATRSPRVIAAIAGAVAAIAGLLGVLGGRSAGSESKGDA